MSKIRWICSEIALSPPLRHNATERADNAELFSELLVVKKLGLAGLDRHALRHTALTWMADSGVPIHMLQRVAGHTDPAVTQRYLHPDHQALAAVGDAF